jgi:hypothetical protein
VNFFKDETNLCKSILPNSKNSIIGALIRQVNKEDALD